VKGREKKGTEREGKRHPRRLQVYSPGRKAKRHRWRLPCRGTVLFPLQIVKGYHATARHLERPRNPKTRTRRQETSAPYFARHSDRRLWLGRSVAFNRCANVPTVQRLIGIYAARNPRTFRHFPRAWFFMSLRLSDYVCEYIPANRACDTVDRLQITDYGKNFLFP